MSRRVATALVDRTTEADVVASLAGRREIELVRRCRDVVELRAVVATGQVDVVVVDPALRGLDRDVVHALRQARVVTVVLTEADAERVSQLGGVPVEVAGAQGLVGALGRQPAPQPPDHRAAGAAHTGSVVAVWGPSGAPGRTTVAIELAAAFSRQGVDTLLVDADTVGPAVGQQLGLVDDTSGVAAAVRIASAGPLRPADLAALAVAVPSGPRVLVGLPNAARWTELRPATWEAVLACVRQTVPVTVVDVGYGLEGDDTRWADPATPQRFGAAISTLATADVLVCVGRSDPVGVVRLVRELPRARDCAPTAVPLVVMNHAGASAARRDVDDVVTEMLDLSVTLHIPDDGGATRSALHHGCAVVEVDPRSPVVLACEELAHRVAQLLGSYDRPRAAVPRSHRRLLRGAHRRHRRRDARVV
jgi:MinD-like ATPase involved in chromosome partitioning or flagellar assembly